MKKLLVLMLVLGLVSAAQAVVVDMVKVDIGQSGGRMGTAQDPLQASDKIGLKLVLKYNAYPDRSYSSYDGYLLSSMNLDLHVTGAGSLSHTALMTSGLIKAACRSAGFSAWSNTAITAGGVDSLMGVAMPDIKGTPAPGPTDLVWGFVLHCDGPGTVIVDLTLAGKSEYKPFTNSAAYLVMTDADLAGNLTIYQIPEPMTVALLGLGGLFLRRRK